MRIFIDTEFNEYKGALISIALVASDGREFYEVLPCENPGPWVAEHVMPILGKNPIDKGIAQTKLQVFLAPYDSVHLISDWPDDIKHFCDFLITGPGERIDTPLLTMQIIRQLNSEGSKIPHNALEDARAIQRQYMAGIK